MLQFQMFLSAHYSGEDLVLKVSPDEPWKKVFGPVFFYLNSVSDGGDPLSLWEDAKTQVIMIKLYVLILIFKLAISNLTLPSNIYSAQQFFRCRRKFKVGHILFQLLRISPHQTNVVD